MATLQIVETSLRDGNQCLWGALGVTTANTLTIAPAIRRSSRSGIRWARIRLSASSR